MGAGVVVAVVAVIDRDTRLESGLAADLNGHSRVVGCRPEKPDILPDGQPVAIGQSRRWGRAGVVEGMGPQTGDGLRVGAIVRALGKGPGEGERSGGEQRNRAAHGRRRVGEG